MEGDIVVKIEGQPDQTLKAGQSFNIPAGAKHDVITGGMKVLATYIIEKGKLVVSPARSHGHPGGSRDRPRPPTGEVLEATARASHLALGLRHQPARASSGSR
jgi:hypothetical protein